MKSPLTDDRIDDLIDARIDWLYADLERRLDSYRTEQSELAIRYAIREREPQLYTPELRMAIEQCGNTWPEEVAYAWTSGTTREPKQIMYPPSRVRLLGEHYLDQVLLSTEASGIRSPRLFLLNSLTPEHSVSGLLANAPPPNDLAEQILADYYAWRATAVQVVTKYETLALQLAILWLMQPHLLTTVNPSSLCALIQQVVKRGRQLAVQVRQLLKDRVFVEALAHCAGETKPLEQLLHRLESDDPPVTSEVLPPLKMIYCWQGGYVRPYLDQLRADLAPGKPMFAPMFSLSTETVTYSIYPRVASQGGLPIYPGCCYEFLPVTADRKAVNLLNPWELDKGEEYVLVVSDQYGLGRYDTQDVFRCLGQLGDVPVLDFQRRSGLNYSFTGEKLTDLQLLEAYRLVADRWQLPAATFTCFPRIDDDGNPAYQFVVLATDSRLPTSDIARALDESLIQINPEYASKRTSQRLAPPKLVAMPAETLMRRLAAQSHSRESTFTQLKILPLYRQLWKDFLSNEIHP